MGIPCPLVGRCDPWPPFIHPSHGVKNTSLAANKADITAMIIRMVNQCSVRKLCALFNRLIKSDIVLGEDGVILNYL